MKIVLEMLTVTFNIPKNMPRMKIYLNRFLISVFITSTTLQHCPGPNRSDRSVRLVRPVCSKTDTKSPRPDYPTWDQIIRHVPETNWHMDRIIRPRIRSSDPVQYHLQKCVVPNILSWWISWYDLYFLHIQDKFSTRETLKASYGT